MSLDIHVPGYTVTINDVSQHIPGCWELLNGHRFRDGGPIRVDNEYVLGADGKAAQPTFPDEWALDLDYLIFGETDPDGEPHTDPAAGLALNIASFKTLIARAPGDDNNQLEFEVLEDATGITRLGLLQVKSFERGDDIFETTAVLSVVVAAGDVAEDGS